MRRIFGIVPHVSGKRLMDEKFLTYILKKYIFKMIFEVSGKHLETEEFLKYELQLPHAYNSVLEEAEPRSRFKVIACYTESSRLALTTEDPIFNK